MKQQKKLGMLLAVSAAAIFATGCQNLGMGSDSMYRDGGRAHHAHGCQKHKMHCSHSAKDRASCKTAKDRAACKTAHMKASGHMGSSNGCNH